MKIGARNLARFITLISVSMVGFAAMADPGSDPVAGPVSLSRSFNDKVGHARLLMLLSPT